MNRIFGFFSIVFVLLFFFACSPFMQNASKVIAPGSAKQSLLRVRVTSQGYVFHRPWQQKRPASFTAIGVIVPGGRVLVSGAMLADHRYIELETLDTQRKQQARVAVVDYEANLALLEPIDPEFLAGRPALPLAADPLPDDSLTVWQVKPNGDVVPAVSQITSIELGGFAQDNYFLTYRLENSLPYRFSNLTLPVVKDNALAGMVLRQSSGGQTVEVIATPVIRHFLKDAADGNYRGFPTAGFNYGATLDPQLRRYIGLPDSVTGIYVQKVIKGGPADAAGLQAGDVVTQVGIYTVSNTGQFDYPKYGQTSLVHMIRSLYFVGDQLPLTVFRKGQTVDLNVTLDHRSPGQYLVPPYVVDQQPEYLIVGGLVIQELSVPYLREYGADWTSTAPIDLVYYQQNEDYRNGDEREKIVIISSVIPTPFSIGNENLSNLVVNKVNGRRIRNLGDVRQALATPVNGFHKIEVKQHPKLLYLDPRQLPEIDKIITERYRIPIPPL